jgi:hypothetical protein
MEKKLSKWKWIAQDSNGGIYKYTNGGSEPRCGEFWFFTCDITGREEREVKLVKMGKENPNFANTLINLETEDYEINDGVLIRIPRKTHLDRLIANVKKIEKKAAKWMDKNRHKLDDVENLDCCFDWDDYPKHDWQDIYKKLKEPEQQPSKETLKYRVALCAGGVSKYIMFAKTQKHVETIERQHEFVRWLTVGWIEVEV